MATEMLSTEVIESVVVHGDLSKLTPAQKTSHYLAVCHALGLTAATYPFQYVKLSGKLVLYATKTAAEQLCAKHGVSVEVLKRETFDQIHMVYVRAWHRKGQPDERFADSEGAVSIANLKGEALANAVMKAATKARRRAVIQMFGLGASDETEVDTIPGAVKIDAAELLQPPAPPAPALAAAVDADAPPPSSPAPDGYQALCEQVRAEKNAAVPAIKAYLDKLSDVQRATWHPRIVKVWREAVAA